ncbi:hypothetical protein [Hymenobacter sp. BT491]|uniref:hypothetical protein n=1 Tax=Hymenobacter sp. BT491 TaxID=2766779 RepID=UPI0016537A98|nr:hypothetical protein [Hymenobacter sp. BT491]MBC6992321.1 hypothetical protein [Hymenobacter sp. BT491]
MGIARSTGLAGLRTGLLPLTRKEEQPMTPKQTLAAGAMALVVAGIWAGYRQQRAHTLQHGRQTVGVLTQVGGNVTVSFIANGLACRGVLSAPYPLLRSGEAFALRYDADGPTTTVVVFEEPVFNKQAFRPAAARRAARRWEDAGTVTFAYQVAGSASGTTCGTRGLRIWRGEPAGAG